MNYEPHPSFPWAHRVLLRVEVGSTAHGTGLEGGEDHDELAIWAQPWAETVGASLYDEPDEDTMVVRNVHQYERGEKRMPAEPGDYDLVVHSTRKWTQLAVRGNPSNLMLLFGPVMAATEHGEALRALAPAFWSDRARLAFLGYATAQRERLEGIRHGRHVNRGGLVEAHGYDTKYAMHAVRLGLQGVEYLETGKLELPIPDPHGALLRTIRKGLLTLDWVIELARANETKLAKLVGVAPPEPDLVMINQWLLGVHAAYR